MRNAIAKLKIESFQQDISEKVFFNHSKIVNWFVSNTELDTENEKRTEKIIGKVIDSQLT